LGWHVVARILQRLRAMEADAQIRIPGSEARRWQMRGEAVRAVCLDGGAGLTLLTHRCLTLGSRYGRCEACAGACPAEVLRVGPDGIEATPGCLGCGRCAAACPTAALRVAGFPAALASLDPRYRSVTIECARVPPANRAPASLVVPCLGGLSVGAVLELCAQADPLPVALIDRGWCAGCPAGGGVAHPAAERLQQAADCLHEAGVPSAHLPRLQSRPLAANLARRGGGSAAAEPTVSRRGFFRSLPAQAISVAASRDAALRGPVRAEIAAPRLPSAERERLLAALQLLAERYGGRVSGALFHRLDIGPDCAGHRVCAAVCPTAALRGYRDAAGATGIAFDAAMCIGCSRCAQACPEKAITLQQGAGTPTSGLRALTRFETRSCEVCGDAFAAGPGDPGCMCERCSKSRRLARAGFHELFGARRMAGDQ
jgi:ferredoxin